MKTLRVKSIVSSSTELGSDVWSVSPGGFTLGHPEERLHGGEGHNCYSFRSERHESPLRNL